MTNLISIILSLVILLIIIYVKDMQWKRNRNSVHDIVYFKLKNYGRILVIISIIIFILVTVIDIKTNNYNRSWTSFITIVLNGLSIALLIYPITLFNIYNIKENEKKFIYTRYVITNIYNKKLISDFNKAGIRVIILSKKDYKTKIATVDEKEFKRKMLSSNLIIKTNDLEFVKNVDDAIYEFNDLNKLYHKIEYCRAKLDNVTRIIKYNVLTYLPLLVLYFALAISKYPVYYNILITIILKLITVLVSEYVYKRMPKDSDIMERKPLIEGKLIGFQEWMFILFAIAATTFCYLLPYQYIIYNGGTIALAITLLLCTFIFNNIFITYALYSESAIIKNIVKSIKYYRVIIYIVIMVILSIIINFISLIGTKNIGIHNYLVSIVFGLIPLLVIEIVKLARFTSTRGVKKVEHKNNKKNRRS